MKKYHNTNDKIIKNIKISRNNDKIMKKYHNTNDKIIKNYQ